jgi:hypothetical protein
LKSKHKIGSGVAPQLRNLLSGKGDPGTILSMLRGSFSPDAYRDLISLLSTNPSTRAWLFHAAFPRSVLKIKNKIVLPNATSLDREFSWAKSYLLRHATQLADFIKLATEFERSLLRDEFEKCHKCLTTIEDKFGASLWLIKRRIACLQMSQGDEVQKEYSNKIKEEATEGGVAAYITHYVSYRNETTVTPKRFEALFSSHINSLNLDADLEDYLKFHILPETEISRESVGNILRWEYSGAVIDYYETLLSLTRIGISSGFEDLSTTLHSTMQALWSKTEDARASMCLWELQPEITTSVEPTAPANLAFDSFLRGDVTAAYDQALRGLRDFPDNSDLFEIAARSASMIEHSSTGSESVLYERMVHELSKYYQFQDSFEEFTVELLKYASNFRGQTLADRILDLTNRELSTSPFETSGNLTHYAVSGSPFVCALRVAEFPNLAIRGKYVMLNRELYGDCLPVQYAEALAARTVPDFLAKKLSAEESAFLKAEIAIQSQDLNGALSEALKLFESPQLYYKKKAVRMVCHCLMGLVRLGECAEFVTTIYLQYQHSGVLPVQQLVDLIQDSPDTYSNANISIPILYDIYSKHFGRQYDLKRRYAYEDFIFGNGVRRPSELRTLRDQFDQTKLIYFLRYIAQETVMDVSTVFEGSRDIAEERISVCRFLAELDPASSERYQGEIKDIVQRLMIQKRVREVQQSKIYVDIDSIRRHEAKNIRDNFNRYKALLVSKTSAEQRALRTERKQKVEQFDLEGLLNLPLPENEIVELFQTMVAGLRDQFVSSNEFGLDGYLSVRIRHGTLQGQLRSPLEKAGLLTQRNSITGGYNISDAVLSKLGVDQNAKVHVGDLLAEFTKEYDDLLHEIINEWIQIKKTPADKGLFDFTLTTLHADILEAQVTEETTLEDFLDLVFSLFSQNLSFTLRGVRRAIAQTAKSKAMALLTKLQLELEGPARITYSRDLIGDIKAARTELQTVFDRVTEWFHLSKSSGEEPFTISDAIQISLESVRTFTEGIDATTEVPHDLELVLFGRLLNGIVDILTIVFENILRHSHSTQRPHAFVHVTYDGELIKVRVENQIGADVASEKNKLRIEEIKTAIRDKTYGPSVSKEGGTGFHKIWKILNHDFKVPTLGTPAELDFGFRSNLFFVNFSLPAHTILSLPAKELGNEIISH